MTISVNNVFDFINFYSNLGQVFIMFLLQTKTIKTVFCLHLITSRVTFISEALHNFLNKSTATYGG